MNKEQYYANTDWFAVNRHNEHYKLVHKELTKWKNEHCITAKCIVHHRTDTEETRKYNNEHYERWGCNEDGSFEYGKYVTFMTQGQHNTEHFTNHVFSDAYRAKMSESTSGEKNGMFGKKHTAATKAILSAKKKKYMKAATYLYRVYKENDGKLLWCDFQRALKNGEITFNSMEFGNGKSIYNN